MLSVGLTGNVASGKSTVAELFAKLGATVIDADQIVHDLQRPGQPVFDAIVERFGPSIRAGDGTLDRAELRRRVFGSWADRKMLERIVHPAVGAERERRVAAARARGDRIVVSDIPLLFEVMDPTAFDAVVLVDAPRHVRKARMVSNRGMSSAQADAMIEAQMPATAKRTRATYVIENDADLDALAARARAVYESLERLAGGSRSA